MTSCVDAAVQTSSPDLHYISNLFSQYCNKTGTSVPDDYLELSVSAMNQTRSSGRSNVLYSLAKGLGSERPDGSDSCFPSQRMPRA